MRHTGRYKGTEKLLLNGKELPYSMLDFWSINLSEILLNMTRGSFAEFLVRCAMTEGGFDALGDDAVKTGVEAFDIDGPEITTPHGKRASRIEVKSSASVQIDTPDDKEPIILPPSQLKFSIRKAIDWQSKSKVAQRNNDLYVFAHYKATSKSDNMLDLSFWNFYVYPTYKIDGDASGLAKQNSISVYRLEMLDVPRVSFRDLFQEIKKVTDDITAHYASNWYGVELISDPSTRSETEKAEIAILSATCREMGYEYSARYIEMFGKRAMDPGFYHGINQAAEKFYKKCVEELHPYNWYHQYPKDVIF